MEFLSKQQKNKKYVDVNERADHFYVGRGYGMRIAAIADLHCRAHAGESIKPVFKGVKKAADVLVIAGDLTDNGLVEEAEVLVDELVDLKMPIIAVLGNHDHENDHGDEIVQVVKQAGVCLLDGTVHEMDGVGFVGTKGFCGGFDKQFIQPFGERTLKTFIQTSIDEAVRLENALAKLQCDKRVAILHYSPIRDTLNGESLEIYPFLGSSRLANAIDRTGVDIIVHGHAHHGSPFGYTAGRIPVHNVSRFVQTRHNQQPYCIFDI